MPFISTEEVSKKRAEIKKAFPNFKFSITKEHHSLIDVAIIEGPLDMNLGSRDYESVKQYNIAENYSDRPEVRDMLLKLYSIVNEGNYTVTEDSDYGSIPKFYVELSIGKWNKPYKCTAHE
jgi:hypothetical protein